MRLSVNSDDPGYAAYKALPQRVIPFVMVDGRDVPMVVTADDRLGYVLAMVCDRSGRAMINARGNGLLHKQLRGKVTIELRRKP